MALVLRSVRLKQFLYQVTRRGSDSAAPWQSYRKTLAKIRDRLRDKGPYAIKHPGEEWKPSKGFAFTMGRVQDFLQTTDEGDVLWVRVHSGTVYAVKLGKLHPEDIPPCPSPRTDAIEQVWDFVHEETQRLRVTMERRLFVVTMGIYNCRHILGSDTWSQHAWANGLDFVIRGADGHNDLQATDAVVDELRHRGYVAQVLWRGVANHFPGHAHVSGAPMQTGTPPCSS